MSDFFSYICTVFAKTSLNLNIMKANHNYRLSALLLALAFSPAALLAQPHSASGTATPFGAAVDTTLVRMYNDSYSLGCMVSGGMPIPRAVLPAK